jgi:hypothetical protein
MLPITAVIRPAGSQNVPNFELMRGLGNAGKWLESLLVSQDNIWLTMPISHGFALAR